ncbi:hypothetical protein JOQ06_025912, partial [Pogonophryne albipinna]
MLLDVDGDSCHHLHNAVKKFAEPFENYLEQLFTDLHTDHLCASDQIMYLKEIAEYMDIPASNPKRFVSHRRLSAYDVGMQTKRLLPVYKRESTAKDLSKKGMTELGKKRKSRVVKKIWFENQKVDLHLSVYLSVLPILKEYVMVFQESQTLVHKLHDKQLQVFVNFLACFIKPEHLKISHKALSELDLANRTLYSQLYIGKVAENLEAARRKHPTAKYAMKSRGMTATMMFKREDEKFGPVDRTLCRNMRSAARRDKAQREERLMEKGRRQVEYGFKKT